MATRKAPNSSTTNAIVVGNFSQRGSCGIQLIRRNQFCARFWKTLTPVSCTNFAAGFMSSGAAEPWGAGCACSGDVGTVRSFLATWRAMYALTMFRTRIPAMNEANTNARPTQRRASAADATPYNEHHASVVGPNTANALSTTHSRGTP